MAQCKFNGCNRGLYDQYGSCILHCEKSTSYQTDRIKGALREFSDALRGYISENIDSKGIVVLNQIFFPCRDQRDGYDYFKLLEQFEQLKGIHFDYCKFASSDIDIPRLEMFFQDCVFLASWSVTQVGLLENVHNVLYQNCEFRQNVDVTSFDKKDKKDKQDEQRLPFEVSLFSNCSFNQVLTLEAINFKQPVFNNVDKTPVKIGRIEIKNCDFEKMFVLNQLEADFLFMENSMFQSKVELQNGNIDNIKLMNVNFKAPLNSYGTRCIGFYCFKSIFDDFAGFESCEFGSSTVNNDAVKFEYVTFSSFTNFRNTQFKQGLDLENTNLKEAPNFLNIRLSTEKTNRETLRLIKDSFDKIGNQIEANKFFALELKAYRKELSGKPMSQEKVIFWFNEKVSNFGQNYLLPLFWLLVCSFIYLLLVLGYENNTLYRIMPWGHNMIDFVSGILNGMAKNIFPFKKVLREGMEFISLLFYAIQASLIWQVIVAVKRHTRRK